MLRERMREVVKNVKERADECVKEQLYGGSQQMGQDGRCEQITEETSSLSSADESVIKHPDTLEHTHTHTSFPHSYPLPLGCLHLPWKFERVGKKNGASRERWWDRGRGMNRV